MKRRNYMDGKDSIIYQFAKNGLQEFPPAGVIEGTSRGNRQPNCERKYLTVASKLEIQSDLIPCPNIAEQAGIANEQITAG